jgi:hypothetical protein
MLARHLLSLIFNVAYKIGFPGWPEPNLDWDSGLGGSVLRKRGLAPAPFFVLGEFALSG